MRTLIFLRLKDNWRRAGIIAGSKPLPPPKEAT